MGKRSRVKGAKWERDVAKLFQGVFSTAKIKRGLGQARCSGEVADVDGVPGLFVECKHGAQTNPRAALRQAELARNHPKAQADAANKFSVAVCKDDNKPPFIAMYLDDFLLFLQEWYTRTRRQFPEEAEHEPNSVPDLASARPRPGLRPAKAPAKTQ